jgi:uncharacterized membrane protein
MKTAEFLSQLDDARIAAAIAEAERNTSGEIRVYVSRHADADALEAAHRRFAQLGMARTRERNAVLLHFAPLTQQFAVWGDTGVHEKCGQDFWNGIAGAMGRDLQAGHFTEAIVNAVRATGELLARHFPRASDDRNELPDTVARD